ncbi:MAG TPA: hypothetical protein VG755_41745 [Nannocystaceae bacterium]|nr:hypothetical protein [Nannocystaceae bacterium]
MARRQPIIPLAFVLACAPSQGQRDADASTSADTGSSGPSMSTSADASSSGQGSEASGVGSSGADESSSGGSDGYECAAAPACDATPGAGPTKVELRIFELDDLVVAEVNGLRRGFWSIPTTPSRDTGRIDVTEWFARGQNQLRLFAANTGGPADVAAQVWVDDVLVLDSGCAACDPAVDAALGIFFDESVAIDSEAFPCAQQLCVHGPEEGSLYIDGTFTGARAPIELVLPPGDYEVGIGSGTDDPPPDAGDAFVHEGRFRRRTVGVADEAVELALTDDDLVAPRPYSFLIVPIRNVQYTNGELGVLADDVPGVMADAVVYASDNMVGPFSYGMVEYTADVHPMLETTVTADMDGFVAIDMTALGSAGLDASAVADHDVVVWAYSSHLADGTPVAQPPCCAWGGGSQIWMHTGWVFEVPIMYYVFIHEWLHTTEDELIMLGYGGADGVHGADEHGYMSGSNGEYDFAQFYRRFIRGQVSEQASWVGAVTGLWQAMSPAQPSSAWSSTLHSGSSRGTMSSRKYHPKNPPTKRGSSMCMP